MTVLRDLLAETAAEERRRAERERAKSQALQEIEDAKRQLEAAKAQLAHVSGKTDAGGASGIDSKAVRAWAAANDVTCPAVGRVPAAVVDRWRAATGGAES